MRFRGFLRPDGINKGRESPEKEKGRVSTRTKTTGLLLSESFWAENRKGWWGVRAVFPAGWMCLCGSISFWFPFEARYPFRGFVFGERRETTHLEGSPAFLLNAYPKIASIFCKAERWKVEEAQMPQTDAFCSLGSDQKGNWPAFPCLLR